MKMTKMLRNKTINKMAFLLRLGGFISSLQFSLVFLFANYAEAGDAVDPTTEEGGSSRQEVSNVMKQHDVAEKKIELDWDEVKKTILQYFPLDGTPTPADAPDIIKTILYKI